MRKTFHLNFDWHFIDNYKDEYLKDDQNTADFIKIDIPHSNKIIPYNYFDEKIFNTVSTYKKNFHIDKEDQGKIIELIFEGIAHSSDIYLNGAFVLTHQGGYDEFRVDITSFVKYGETNYLTVLVDSSENKDIPPFGNVVDYLGYGGIYREVRLEIIEQEHIKTCFLKSYNTDKGLICDLFLSTNEGNVEIEVYDQDVCIKNTSFNVTDFKQTWIMEIDNLALWSVNNPYLYNIKLKLKHNDNNKDEFSTKFGFRSIKFTQQGFYLNGEYLKLRGLNRHQSFPYVGYAMPKSAQEKDAEILKFDLGVNIVRTSHYMQSKHFLNRCDEIGLLVFEEIPGWQYIGGEQFKANSYKNVESMILRDFNHPSIIMWGVRINESTDDEEFYKETNRIARLLDNTRPTGGVRNFKNSQMFEDVYTFNDFTNSGGTKVLQKPQHVKKNVPYMVTEYNGHMFPTKAFDDESHRVEHALRHYRVIEEASKNKKISGTIGWCMADYNTHEQFGSGDKICYHGVLDMFRNFKYAAYIYSSQQNQKPVLEILSTFNYGEYAAGYMREIIIATNCDYVKVYKNDCLIDTVSPKNNNSIINRIIKLHDLIGNQLETNEGFSKRDSEKLKKIFLEINKYGYNLPIKTKLSLLYILKKNRLKVSHVPKLYFKYANSNYTYKFCGYKDENLVKTVIKENVKEVKYVVALDKEELTVASTYDVARVVVKKIDQNNNVLTYAADPIMINVSGGIDLIGPKELSLQGGMIAFWVKSNKNKNQGRIEVCVNNNIITKNLEIK